MSRCTDQIDRILRKYESRGSFANGASEAEIRKAEQSLGLLFPNDYRHFLACYGAGNFGECEIYGIISQSICCIPDGIWATRFLRQQYHMPAAFIAIAFDGYGGYFCIDTAERDREGRCPVVLWRMGQDEIQQAKCVAESFERFLLQQLKEQIDKIPW